MNPLIALFLLIGIANFAFMTVVMLWSIRNAVEAYKEMRKQRRLAFWQELQASNDRIAAMLRSGGK